MSATARHWPCSPCRQISYPFARRKSYSGTPRRYRISRRKWGTGWLYVFTPPSPACFRRRRPSTAALQRSRSFSSFLIPPRSIDRAGHGTHSFPDARRGRAGSNHSFIASCCDPSHASYASTSHFRQVADADSQRSYWVDSACQWHFKYSNKFFPDQYHGR